MVSSIAGKWTNLSPLKKFILVNMIIPWTPILLLATAYFAPPEVYELVEVNGKLVGMVVGTAWQIASAAFSGALF